jgi:hypothetical protein
MKGSIKDGINACCVVLFQELNHFLFYYVDEAGFSDFADEPA